MKPSREESRFPLPLGLGLALIVAGFLVMGVRGGNWTGAVAFAAGAGGALLLGFLFGRFVRRAAEEDGDRR